MSAYGFVGTGEITAAIVEGLTADVAEPPAVFLSPRGRRIGQELASRFPTVQVCDSNQDVLDHATTVVVAVRPQVVDDVLGELSFQPRHVVVSAVAAVRLDRLRELTAPAGHVVRSIPLPASARRQSLTAMYPDNATARTLYELVGDVVVPGEEALLDAFSAATSTFAAHLDYLATIAGWMTEQGVDSAAATAFTTHIFGQLGQSLAGHTGPLDPLIAKYQTPGGINEQLLTDLRGDSMPDTVRRALDRILKRVRG